MSKANKQQNTVRSDLFSLIQFDEENCKLFECIPDGWFLDEERTQCYWPPSKGKSFRLRALNKETPDSAYTISKCIFIRGEFATYNEGFRAAREKISQCNTSSADENLEILNFRRKHPVLALSVNDNFENIFTKQNAQKRKHTEDVSSIEKKPRKINQLQQTPKPKEKKTEIEARVNAEKSQFSASNSGRKSDNQSSGNLSLARSRSPSLSRSNLNHIGSGRESEQLNPGSRLSSRNSEHSSRRSLHSRSRSSTSLGSRRKSRNSGHFNRRSRDSSSASHSRHGSKRSTSSSECSNRRSRCSSHGSSNSSFGSRSSSNNSKHSSRRSMRSSGGSGTSSISSRRSIHSSHQSHNSGHRSSHALLYSSPQSQHSVNRSRFRQKSSSVSSHSKTRSKSRNSGSDRSKSGSRSNTSSNRRHRRPTHGRNHINSRIQRNCRSSRNLNSSQIDDGLDRRLTRMEVTINKIFVMVGDIIKHSNKSASYRNRPEKASINKRLPNRFEEPELPIHNMKGLTVFSKLLKRKEVYSFMLEQEKDYCAPRSRSTDNVVMIAYLKRFITVKLRCDVALKDAKGKKELTLLGDFKRVYEFIIDVMTSGYKAYNKRIKSAEVHNVLRTVWGRSNQMWQEELRKNNK